MRNILYKLPLALLNFKKFPLELLMTQILKKGTKILPGGKLTQLLVGYLLQYFILKILYKNFDRKASVYDIAKKKFVILKPKFLKLFQK